MNLMWIRREIKELKSSIIWKSEPACKAFILGAKDSPTEAAIEAYRERLPRDVFHRRLILCLYVLGTNTGFKRLPSVDLSTTYSDLQYVRSRYIHKEQLGNAIAHVSNAIFEVRRAEI